MSGRGSVRREREGGEEESPPQEASWSSSVAAYASERKGESSKKGKTKHSETRP